MLFEVLFSQFAGSSSDAAVTLDLTDFRGIVST